VLVVLCALAALVLASSHSEAPGSLKDLRADLTDVYAFVSYETGRAAFTTLIMNILPLEAPYAGPNYGAFSDQHFYEFNIDNNGDCVEDIIIQFLYGNRLNGAGTYQSVTLDCAQVSTVQTLQAGIALNINGTQVPVPLKFVGPITAANQASLNFIEYYSVNWIIGNRATGVPYNVTNSATGSTTFNKPFDYAGEKTFGNAAAYQAYASTFQYNINIPKCATPGKMFVGQRKESFHVTLGKIFDLVNMNPVVPNIPQCDNNNDLWGFNVGSFILEVPSACLAYNATWTSIGVWSTIRTLTHAPNNTAVHIPVQQVSRLGNPLVNEVVIGLPDKDKFNGAVPSQDGANFLTYVTNPTLPAILQLLFGVTAPTNFPRQDLVIAFLLGVPGVNVVGAGGACEYLRLNTAIAPTIAGKQNALGVIAGDLAGYPNGRRPGDDVIDIALRVVMGVLCTVNIGCHPADAPVGAVPFTDGSPINAGYFDTTFPYLQTPYPGATIANQYVTGGSCTAPTWAASATSPCNSCTPAGFCM